MRSHANEVLSNAVARVGTAAANFLPGLLALLIIMVFTVVVAFIVQAIIRRALKGIRFDDRVHRWVLPVLAEWEPPRKPSALIARLSFWTIVTLGLLVGIAALDANLTSVLVLRAFEYLPNVAAAAMVLILDSWCRDSSPAASSSVPSTCRSSRRAC